MSPLGVLVTTGETPQSAGIATQTGTAFVVGLTDQGPQSEPGLVRSLSEYVSTYGPRTTTSAKVYDAVNTVFALGGNRCYVQRVGTNAKVAELTLKDSGTKPTVLVEYATAGIAGNSYKIEVTTGGGKYEVLILNSSSEILEKTGKLETQKELLEWSEKHKTYVKFTASAASGFTTNAPEKLTATALSGGLNTTETNAAAFTAAINFIPKTAGPGQIIAPGNTEESVHTALAEHASKNNRFAIGDLADSSNPATIIGAKGTISSSIAGYISFPASTCIIPGLTFGTTRTVAGSAVMAGLCAQVAATGNDNQAPAGRRFPLGSFVLGFTNTFLAEGMEELNEHGICPFAERFGVLCLYGFVTALSKNLDLIFWQASASRERMHLVAQSEEIGEEYTFATIDGRGQLLAKFQGELQGMIAEHWQENALFGDTAAEAGEVIVKEPVNTAKTAAEGELNAELIVRISPFAEAVRIRIVSTPVTEEV